MQTFEISKNGILRDKDRIKNRIDVDVQDTFLCVQNINKRRIYLSLFELGHFSCQFNAKRVRLYLAKWASCDNRARWSFQIRRSHCLVTFSPVSPSWYLTNSRIYRRGRLLPPLCFVLLSSIFVFFQNQRWRTQTLSQLSVRSHEKYSVGDGRTGNHSVPRGSLSILGVGSCLGDSSRKRTRSKSFVTSETIRFLW